jgi:hypothetical protein
MLCEHKQLCLKQGQSRACGGQLRDLSTINPSARTKLQECTKLTPSSSKMHYTSPQAALRRQDRCTTMYSSEPAPGTFRGSVCPALLFFNCPGPSLQMDRPREKPPIRPENCDPTIPTEESAQRTRTQCALSKSYTHCTLRYTP